MIENHKTEIVTLLEQAGEPVNIEDAFSFSTLGEGMGYSSYLWTTFIGERKYAVKITDPSLRVAEMMKARGNVDKDTLTRLFTEHHNRELQVYRWFQNCPFNSLAKVVPRFYGGTPCNENKPGLLIMADLSSESVPVMRAGLDIHTILSIIDGVAAYQSAFLSTGDPIDPIPKDLLFTMVSSSVIRCIDVISAKEWLTEKWKRALISWADPNVLRSMQYQLENRDLAHTLCHMDLWTNNLLFTEGNEGLELLAVVDWQAAALGNPLLDVASVIGINLNPYERRAQQKYILQHYIDAIERRRHGFIKEFPIGAVEDLLPSFRRALRFAALQLVLTLGYRAEEDVVEDAAEDERNSEKLGIYSARLKGLLEDIVG